MITMITIIVVGIIILAGFVAYMSYYVEKQRAMECHREVERELKRLERKLKDDSMRYTERESTKERYWETKIKSER